MLHTPQLRRYPGCYLTGPTASYPSSFEKQSQVESAEYLSTNVAPLFMVCQNEKHVNSGKHNVKI